MHCSNLSSDLRDCGKKICRRMSFNCWISITVVAGYPYPATSVVQGVYLRQIRLRRKGILNQRLQELLFQIKFHPIAGGNGFDSDFFFDLFRYLPGLGADHGHAKMCQYSLLGAYPFYDLFDVLKV